MSTRANIIIRGDFDQELIFYRHCDGYPEGVMPSLEKFLGWVKEGRIRTDAGQSAGWLILIGADEYKHHRGGYDREFKGIPGNPLEPGPADDGMGWQCGAYEPTDQIHADIEYLYVVDLREKTINIDGQDGYTYEGKYHDNRWHRPDN